VPDHWVRIGERGRGMGGATNLKVGGGGQCIRRGEVNTVKILKFEKGGGCMTPPPSSYGGTVPGEGVRTYQAVVGRFLRSLLSPPSESSLLTVTNISPSSIPPSTNSTFTRGTLLQRSLLASRQIRHPCMTYMAAMAAPSMYTHSGGTHWR